MPDRHDAPPAHWAQLFESAELLAAVLEPDGRIRHGNAVLQRHTGWLGRDITGLNWLDNFVPADAVLMRARFLAWLAGSPPFDPMEGELLKRDGGRRLVRWHPCLLREAAGQITGLSVLGIDITEQRAQEARTQRLADFYRALLNMGQAIAQATVPLDLYRSICRIAVESGHATMAWIGVVEGAHVVPVAWGGRAHEYTRGLNTLIGVPGQTAETIGPTSLALASGRPYVCNDFFADPSTVPWRSNAARFGVKASGAFPIRRAGKPFGTLNLYFGEVSAFDNAMVELVEQMVANLSVALENIDREAARALAVREAQEGYERFQRVFATLPLPAAIFGLPDGLCIDANEACAQLLGVTREALIGHNTAELDLGLDLAERQALCATLKHDPHIRDLEARMLTRSGERRDVLINVEPINFYGQQCLLNINIDITERKRSEQALREREAQLSGIVETAMDAIITVNEQGQVMLFNQAAASMFCVTPQEAIGSNIERFIPVEHRHAHRQHLARFAAAGKTSQSMNVARELTGLRANGEAFPMEASISRAGEGKRQLMTVMARDVTQLRQAEKAQLARNAAEAANRAKTQFLSRISHELRTPLNAILGFAQLMRIDTRDPLSDRHLEQLDLVLQAGSHLRTLIDETLDVSGIEAGRLAMAPQDFELCELLDGVVRMSEPHAQQFQVTLQLMYGNACPLAMHGDPDRLRQVLLNLVSNAIKYNRPGGWVRVELTRDPYFAHITVRDNGLGMTEQQKAGLFQPFNRLGREHSNVQGTGIGLVLVRQIVGLMDGQLTLESSENEGTTVRVTLPTADGHQVAPQPTALPAQAAPKDPSPEGVVLYIEDNPINAILVGEMLSFWPQTQLVVAIDGASGLERARALRPSVVLLDMQLPDMDGLAVLRQLKADEATRDLAVVALSANTMAKDMKIARAAGALDYWTKPIDFEHFTEGMRRLLRTPPAQR
ncbi:MAG: PAS domain S-box protein [Burkholderiales bacterium]|nr:PAS domain S-box protein [Burkholderiales bacterium]